MNKIVEFFNFNPKKLSKCFDNKVREMCKSCKRYGFKATCPPHIESINYYKKFLPTYKYGKVILYKYININIDNWEQDGKKSSIDISNKLVLLRNELLQNNHFFVIGFGAGSCKICKKCMFPCKYPEKSFIPMEATGLNIIKLVKKICNISIEFPVGKQKFFYRVGLLLWD